MSQKTIDVNPSLIWSIPHWLRGGFKKSDQGKIVFSFTILLLKAGTISAFVDRIKEKMLA
ncbi:hypothetical protein [Ponticaulis profundi]|uniref:Uncharacterized protein n=1 Tax=Ponticaulis profundi TaxID=2665222 RepID=A0ABW1SB29_9PROT